MYVIDRGTSENVGKRSGPECGWCTTTGFSASNKWGIQWKCPRAHLHVAVWRNELQPDSPAIDPTAFGLSLEEWSKTLIPTTLPSDTPLAPDNLLKLVRCACSSETPCKTQRCGCSSASLACSVFCACQGGQGCFNGRTKQLFRQTMTKMNKCISTEPGWDRSSRYGSNLIWWPWQQ